MSKRQNRKDQVVYRHEKAGYTEVWHKDGAGRTTKSGYRRHHHQSGRVTDRYGRYVDR